ncbi:hypothetical protein [Mycobacterium spongiae]|uniref:Uncharacterized protein n=1 Tax=Mycobacterium spongiae TaxID=886343 RepID=A0A975JX17_9MYCO|nr:hypothetical protein [Mycobacterium spongiae]QUR67261.1 hypothetical protein F6B93_09255 [Mycobacterium spongiae]
MTTSMAAVSTPYPRVSITAATAHQPVAIVMTQARIDRARRAEFVRQTSCVMDAMVGQPGLLGYSARRQVFSMHAWRASLARAHIL